MKKITAFIGTPSRRSTFRAVQEFEKSPKGLGDIDFEYVFLSDYDLEFCRRCKECFDKGEELCPLHDDRDTLIEKMEQSDGVIFATPNYAFHVSARMKNLFDRTAFIFHRPRFFDRVCTAVVAQGMFGGGSIAKYLCSSGENLGFRSTKGCCVNTLESMTPHQEEALVREVSRASARFHKELMRWPTPPPSFFRLMAFRMARSRIKALDDSYKDYRYYRDEGWLCSGYYHETSLGPIKKLAGCLFDFIGRRMARRAQSG